MYKITPVLFFIFLSVASCAHSNLDDHTKVSKMGQTKQEIFKKFGTPDETSEDSNYSYYIYNTVKKSGAPKTSDRKWRVRYIFKHNQVVNIETELIPTANELEKLESISNEQTDTDSQFKPL